jgi:hypothetical protein
MTDPIRDELHRLSKEFSKLLDNSNALIERTAPEHLMTHFGLTQRQAKCWLEKEPDFSPSDGSYHEPSNRRRVNRTLAIYS